MCYLKPNCESLPLANSLSDTVSNFGVFLDSSFKLDKQVSSVEKSSFYQLSQISKAKRTYRARILKNVSMLLLLLD